MKKVIYGLAVLSLMCHGAPAVADVCTIDAVPAATLLLPYFEVDLTDPWGVNTLFSVNNASAAPVLAHVVLWTDLSVATIDFDVYLTGYDVQTFNLRDLFHGVAPQTAPDSAISNLGAFSLPHAVPASCAGGLPIGDIPPSLVTLIEQAHTGVAVDGFGGNCAGVSYGERVARGYVTVDVVRECSTEFPDTPGYFDTIAGFDNVLWGDAFYVDEGNNFAQGGSLVHVEADPAAYQAGDYTFYGRHVSWDASDAREPLPSHFATRFLRSGAFTGGTHLLCWRDSKAVPSPSACGTLPAPFPLAQNQLVIFDEEENPELVPESRFSPGVPGQDILACPFETQRVEVGGPELPVAPEFGWLYFNLNTSTGAAPDPYSQAWVSVVMSADGRFSVGFDAIQLDDLCTPTDVLLGE